MLAAPAFLFLNEAAQLFGIADDRTLVRTFVAPFAQVVKKLVNVIAGLGGQLVLNPPYFFQNWIRFHISMSYQFDGCANFGHHTPQFIVTTRNPSLPRGSITFPPTCHFWPFFKWGTGARCGLYSNRSFGVS